MSQRKHEIPESNYKIIGLPENPTAEEKMKYEICQTLIRYQRENNLSEGELVEKIVPPTVPISAPITLAVGATGATVAGIGHITDNENAKAFGMDLVNVASKLP